MTTYTIAIKHDDDRMQHAKGGLGLEQAERMVEYYYHNLRPGDTWAGLAVIEEATGNIYSEMEW